MGTLHAQNGLRLDFNVLRSEDVFPVNAVRQDGEQAVKPIRIQEIRHPAWYGEGESLRWCVAWGCVR